MKLIKILSSFFLLTLIFSCSDDDYKNELDSASASLSHSQMDQEASFKNESFLSYEQNPEFVETEKRLEEIAYYFGIVFRNENAKKELFDLAKLEGNDGEIQYNLPELFEERVNPLSKEHSAIVNAFNELPINPEKLDSIRNYIFDNKLELFAPYLAENFRPEEVNELTMTYWYKEMYDLVGDNPDFQGETPGRLIDLKGTEVEEEPTRTEDREGSGRPNTRTRTNDEYAENNPTVVVRTHGAARSNTGGTGGRRGHSGRSGRSNIPYQGLTCETLTDDSNSVLEVQMPKFQLRGNIRRWPNPNLISLWVARGEYTVGSDGTPTPNVKVDRILNDYKVTRKKGRKKKWVSTNTSFIIHNWKYESEDMQIVWGSLDHRKKLEQDIAVTTKPTDDGVTTSVTNTTKVQEGNTYNVNSLTIDKCALLKDIDEKRDKNFGLYDDEYPIYGFGKIRAYFTIEKY